MNFILPLLFFLCIFVPIFYSAIRRANLALALIVANLLVFVMQVFTGRFWADDYYDLIFFFAFPQHEISTSWLYQCFTYSFLHGNLFHILGNMLVLFFVGMALEERIGFKKFLIVYFVSMVAAVLFDTLFFYGRWNIAIGASGAVSGILGCILILYPKIEIPMVIGPLFLMRVKVWIAVLFFFVMETMLSFFSLLGMESGIAHVAHVGGVLCGMMLGYGLGKVPVIEKHATLDIAKLRSLSKNEMQLKAIENMDISHPELSEAWLRYFAEHTECPRCHGRMQYTKQYLVCAKCGNKEEVWK
jgi:membrane associated rhomboid family serine protease